MKGVCVALVVAAVLAAAHGSRHSSLQERPWLDPSKPVPERVQALLPKLNLAEKLAMTYATHTRSSSAQVFNQTGIGAVKYESAFSCGNNISRCIEDRNELQQLFLNNSRLGIPISFINEGLHGGAPGGTIFPMPISQGHSWNASLVGSIAQAIASEANAIGVDSIFAPVVNMMQDARFGRLQEGFGENPITTSHLGRASVIGLQGGSGDAESYLPQGSVCSLGKHYAAYGAAVGGLNGGPAEVTNRTLHDIYLRPWFAMAAVGLRAVMPSHNTVLDVPAHGNKWLIDRTLRQEYGFKGVALSDCNDIGAIVSSGMVKTPVEAAVLALRAGVDWDLQCGGGPYGYNPYLSQAIAQGLLQESELDDTVARVLTQKFAAGLFDRPYASLDKVHILDNPAHRQLAREAAQQGTVLLQNTNNALPIDLRGKSVGLFGPLAAGSAAETALIGSYVLGGARIVTVAEALANTSLANLTLNKGCSATGPPGSGCTDLNASITLAQQVDVAILVLGDDHGQCGEWQDRDSLDLGGGQLQLLEAVAGVAPVTIVVLVHGRPQTFGLGNQVLSKVDALLAAWRPGEEGGSAIVDLITGAANPSGKVAQSWPRTVGQVLGGSNPWLQRVRGKWVANHRDCADSDGRCYDGYVNDGYESTPLFYYGWGLSYTQFSYEHLEIKPVAWSSLVSRWRLSSTAPTQTVAEVEVTVKNIGKVAGTEVVQVYITELFDLPFVPYWKRLVGFGRIALQPGQQTSITIPLLVSDVAQFDTDMTLRVFPGTYNITVGGASNNTPLHATWECK